MHLYTRLLVLGLSWRFVVEHGVGEWRLDVTDVFEIAEVTDDLLVHLGLSILLASFAKQELRQVVYEIELVEIFLFLLL